MKLLWLLLCLGFILNACVKQSITDLGTDPLGETSMTFDLKMPHTTPATTRTSGGVAKDDQLNTINMLVFDQATGSFLYGRKGITPTTSGSNIAFTAKLLMTNKSVNIHLLANPTDGVDPIDLEGKNESDLKSIVTSLALNAPETTSLPMHGILPLTHIDLNTKVKTPVDLTRSVARVDVLLNNAVTNFKLQKLTAYFTPNQGYWVDSKTTPPTIPTTGMTLITPASPLATNVTAIENQLFIYEKAYSPTVSEGTRIVVQGEYTDNGGTKHITYYPIDFNKIAADGTVTAYHVLRNHQYIFTINRVSGLGYDTEAEASIGTSSNIKVNLLPWNSSEMGEIVFDGVNHFSIQSKEVILKGDDVSTVLTVSSNIPAGEWGMKWETVGGDYLYDTEIKSAKFKVSKPATGNSGELTFSTRTLHAGVDKLEKLHIRVAKRLDMTINVNQVVGAQDILTVDGKTGTITDVPLVYHEGGLSKNLEVITGNENVSWNATTDPASTSYMSFPSEGVDGAILRNMFSQNSTAAIRKGTVTVTRGSGDATPVLVEFIQEGKPTFNNLPSQNMWHGSHSITQMITGSSHSNHYEWTASLSNLVQTSGDVSGSLPIEQVFRLARNTTNSNSGLVDADYAPRVTGTGGEYLVIDLPARLDGAVTNYTAELTVSYKRKVDFLPPLTVPAVTTTWLSAAHLEIGDLYPPGKTGTDLTGVVYALNPTRILLFDIPEARVNTNANWDAACQSVGGVRPPLNSYQTHTEETEMLWAKHRRPGTVLVPIPINGTVPAVQQGNFILEEVNYMSRALFLQIGQHKLLTTGFWQNRPGTWAPGYARCVKTITD